MKCPHCGKETSFRDLYGEKVGESYRKFKASNADIYILVDEHEFERVSQYKWRVYPNKEGDEYARRSVSVIRDGVKVLRNEYLHHFILGKIKGLVVDHINRDKFDNTKSNLRHCTHSDNQANKINEGKQKNNSSGYRGVSYYKPKGKWRPVLQKDGVTYYMGYFDTPQEAYEVYKIKYEELYGRPIGAL